MLATLFISSAHAQDAAGVAPSAFSGLLPLVFIFAVFYFLLIRPQQKKYKQHQAMLNAIEKGDEVVTGGGIIGKVTKLSDENETVHVVIAEGVEVKVPRSTISSVKTKKNAPKPANNNDKKAEKISSKQ